ncbi:MAG: LiaF transmembrane domain-containing protein [Christensenellales bacterium]|jgi:hypothetical protein
MRKFNWVGMAVILVGAALILNSFNVLPMSAWSLLPPALLILIGIDTMLSANRFTYWGLVLLLGGAYWMLSRFGVLPAFSVGIIAGCIVILLGLGLLFPKHSSQSQTGASFNSTSTFSSDKRTASGGIFEGCNVNVIFGGSELDMRGYEGVAEGASIFFKIAFGGAEVIIPTGWRVDNDGLTCIFGGIDYKGAPRTDAEHVVRITGSVLFGGVEIKYRD